MRRAGLSVAGDTGATRANPEHAAPLKAGRYDQWFESAWGRYASSVERAAIERATGHLAGRRLLDVGCGSGRFTAEMERADARVVGCDLDPAMLSLAARRVRGPLLVADAHRLPFRDGAFDVVVAVTVCEFTADPRAVVAELVRVARPGGRITIGALNRGSPWGLSDRGRFRRAPWRGARFLSRRQLLALGETHGATSLLPALFAPGIALRGAPGRLLEAVGRACAPALGAFQVLTIEKPASRQPG